MRHIMKNRIILISIGLASAIVAGIVIFQIIHKDNEIQVELKDTFIEDIDNYRYNRELGNFIGFDSIQQNQFKDLEFAYRQKLNTLRSELIIAEQQLLDEMNNKQEMAELRKHSSKIGVIHTKIKDATIDHFFAVKEICNPEQEEKLQRLFSNYERKEFRNRGKGRGNEQRGRQHQMRGRRFSNKD